MDKISEIKAKLASAANKETIEESTLIRDLGLDSLDVVEMLLQLEEEYDVHFDDVDMNKISTVGDLLNEISKQL